MDKISANDNIIIENLKKDERPRKFLHEFPSRRFLGINFIAF